MSRRPSACKYLRANIFVDDEVPTNISNYVDEIVFHSIISDDAHLHLISEKLEQVLRNLSRNHHGKLG